MQGSHLTADLHGCALAADRLGDAGWLRSRCVAAVEAAGLRAVGELFHTFPAPGGVTGVVLLAESHLALHTWPESGEVTLDAYVCNRGADHSSQAEALVASLVALFEPSKVDRQRLARGAA
jgi:S-adenosylmethionine decarboxylase